MGGRGVNARRALAAEQAIDSVRHADTVAMYRKLSRAGHRDAAVTAVQCCGDTATLIAYRQARQRLNAQAAQVVSDLQPEPAPVARDVQPEPARTKVEPVPATFAERQAARAAGRL